MDNNEALVTHFKTQASNIMTKMSADGYTTDEALVAADQKSLDEALASAEQYAAAVKAAVVAEEKAKTDQARLDALGSLPEGKSADSASDDGSTGGASSSNGTPNTVAGKAQNATPEVKSAGALFVETKSYKDLQEKGGYSEASASTGAVAIQVSTKSLITSPSVPVVNRYENYAPMPLTLLDAITVTTTGLEAIKTHRLIYSANNAAIVGDGVSSPESDFVWQSVTISAEDMTHWVPVDNNTLNDHGMVEGMINTELAFGVDDKLQTEIMTDLAATTGLLLQAFDTDIFKTLLAAKTKAADVRTPTGILMSAQDAETIQNAKGTDGHYIGGGPFNYANLSVWGLPVIISSAVPAGTAYVGNIKTIAWRERAKTTITTGWRNTQFTDRQMSIMAVARGMTDVTLPGAMVKATLA